MKAVRTATSDTELIARARVALAEGPLDDVQLLGRVLSLPGAPPRVAARIADSLFSRHEAFVRLPDGAWDLQRGIEVGREMSPRLVDFSYAVVDVETTGGSARSGHRVTEIAVVPVDNGVVGEPWVRLVNPERAIMPAVISLTRITQEMVRRAPRFRDVADEVVGRLHGRVFVAHNATFDWGFVNAELERARGVSLNGDRLCTVKLARTLLPRIKRRSLDHMAFHFGLDIVQRHRAADDAHATARLLLRLLGLARDQELDSWPLLSARLDRRTAKAKRKRRAMPRSVDYDTSA